MHGPGPNRMHVASSVRRLSYASGFSRPVFAASSTIWTLLATAVDAVNQVVILDVVMPTKKARGDGRSTKRVKLDATSSNAYRYSDGADIERRLQVQTQDDLLAGESLSTYYVSGLPTSRFRSTHCAS
jgi:hypothetical protein